MKRSLLVCAVALAFSGGLPALATEPDNTGVNTRDKDGKTLTVFDQGSSESDRKITAAVREMVVEDDSLSTDAHNVKIITVTGVVTLRGPVNSLAEKNSIESKAKSVAGVSKVDNQLDVATK
jgi:hyperosmotically inducible periplasmic protein